MEGFRTGLQTLTELAGEHPETVLVRRIGEPVQVDHEALALLTVARLLPGERVRVHRADGRVVAVREDAPDSTAVSLPDDVAQHVFAALI